MLKWVGLMTLRCLFLILLGGGLWVTGLMLFTKNIPIAPPDNIERTEGIVIFTGGKTRLKVAFDLFQQKKGEYLLISGVNPNSTLPKKIERMPLKSKITLGYSALDTAGNAKETAEWVEHNSIKTLRLITSNYHMPRSLFELRTVLPLMEIISHPVVGEDFTAPKWWLNPPMLYLVIEEYNKFLFSFTRRFFESIQHFFIGNETDS